jgi:hypothetical protein
MDRIRKVIDRLRAWAENKTEEREEWARTVWWAVHMSASAKSTCSMAMHVFPGKNRQNLARDIPLEHGRNPADYVFHEAKGEASKEAVPVTTIKCKQLAGSNHGRESQTRSSIVWVTGMDRNVLILWCAAQVLRNAGADHIPALLIIVQGRYYKGCTNLPSTPSRVRPRND